ncbi:MAG TPA: TolC family protein [Bacteroidales bacterium]|nr:TolC family protein [Bacteroidales bacterium]
MKQYTDMQKLYFLLFIVLTGIMPLKAQKVITLKECYEMAYATAPLSAEKEVYDNIWQIRNRNLLKGWLPSLDANGSFIYNSSVVNMEDAIGSLPLPGTGGLLKPLPHEQYRITLDISQMIYDGGAIKSARALEEADLHISKKQNESDLYKLRAQVNSHYFSMMLLDRQKELLQNYLEVIDRRIASLNSAVLNGMILKSDIDVLSSERLKLEQQLTENGIRKKSLLRILSALTGTEIDTSVRFVLPPVKEELTDELARPELRIFDLRREQLDASLSLINSERMPRAFGFATFGYGNPPGNNFFRDEFAPYYILGAGIRWNIFDWNKARNEKQIVSLRQNLIQARKNDMEDNLKRLLDAKSAEISSLESLLLSDTELIGLRKRITAAAGSQYDNGTITATEFMNVLNSEKEAVINYEIHRINLAMARIEYLNICGKEIE